MTIKLHVFLNTRIVHGRRGGALQNMARSVCFAMSGGGGQALATPPPKENYWVGYWKFNGVHSKYILSSFSQDATAPPPPVGQGLLIIEDSWLHSDAPQSVGLLWTSDGPVAETSTWQHETHTTDRQTSMPPARFEPAIPASELPQTHALDRAASGTEKYTNNQQNAFQYLWHILVTMFSICFGRYCCCHLQGDVIMTRIQTYKCG